MNTDILLPIITTIVIMMIIKIFIRIFIMIIMVILIRWIHMHCHQWSRPAGFCHCHRWSGGWAVIIIIIISIISIIMIIIIIIITIIIIMILKSKRTYLTFPLPPTISCWPMSLPAIFLCVFPSVHICICLKYKNKGSHHIRKTVKKADNVRTGGGSTPVH